MALKLTFLGAAGTVTGSKYLLEEELGWSCLVPDHAQKVELS
jgi:hypothetical protein